MELWILGLFIIAGVLLLNKIIFSKRTELTLKKGSKAPDFSLQDEQGKWHSLAEVRGHKVALVFYPRPNTPGCTKEMCSIRDRFAQLQDAGIAVFGISSGSQEDMQRFKEQQHLSFPLLRATSDVLEKYGTTGDVTSFFVPKRYTFLINEQGTVIAIITQVDVERHADQIIEEFERQTTH